MSLTRLEKEGVIRRLAWGIYEYPRFSELLQCYAAPSPDKIAQAYARNFGWHIAPSGNAALNLLGLSTQVPATWTFVSDGAYRTYQFGKITIQFKHTSNKNIAEFSYITALVVQALKTLGKQNIDERVISQLSSRITNSDKEIILKEARYTTAWIYQIIKSICKGVEESDSGC